MFMKYEMKKHILRIAFVLTLFGVGIQNKTSEP